MSAARNVTLETVATLCTPAPAFVLNMFTADMFPVGVEGGGPFECAPYLEIQENQRIATIEHAPFVDGKYQMGTSPRPGLHFASIDRSEAVAVEDRRAS